jgi:catalase (peroxidase I)
MHGPTLGVCLGRVDDVDGANSVPLGPSAVQVEIANCGTNSKTGEGNYNTEENPGGYDFAGDNPGFNNDCTSKNNVTGANKVGLIYVNPEGVDGVSPDTSIPIYAEATTDEWKHQAEAVRRTFARMGMNDEETVALIGGGHSFGKAHGACPLKGGVSPFDAKQKLKGEGYGDAELDEMFRGGHDNYVDYSTPYGCAPGYEPKVMNGQPCSESISECCVAQKAYIYQGECGTGVLKGKGPNSFTSGLEGPWTTNPTSWDNSYYTNLVNYDWVRNDSPAGAQQWKTACPGGRGCEAASDPGPVATGAFGGYEKIMMLTTDMVLVNDIGGFRTAVDTFATDSVAFDKAWANAWHKLTTVNFGDNSEPVCYTTRGDLVDSENGMFYGFAPDPLDQERTDCDSQDPPNPSFSTYQTGVDDPAYEGQPAFDPAAMGGPYGF